MLHMVMGCATDGSSSRRLPVEELLTPLEAANRNHLLPSISGKRNISDIMTTVLALLTWHGGLGMANPQEDVIREYTASCSLSRPFSELILQQEGSITPNCDGEQRRAKTSIFQQKSTHTAEAATRMLEEAPAGLPRMIELASEKGASSWLSTLPIEEHRSRLSKTAFWDAIHMRYGWKPEQNARKVYLWCAVECRACLDLPHWWFYLHSPQ